MTLSELPKYLISFHLGYKLRDKLADSKHSDRLVNGIIESGFWGSAILEYAVLRYVLRYLQVDRISASILPVFLLYGANYLYVRKRAKNLEREMQTLNTYPNK